MDSLRTIAQRLRVHEPWWIEIFSGATAVAWGIYAAMDGRSMTETPLYEPIVEHMPGWVWISWAIGGGLAQIGASLVHVRWARIVTTMAMSVWFKILCVSAIVSPAPSPGAMVYAGWGLGNLAACARLLTP